MGVSDINFKCCGSSVAKLTMNISDIYCCELVLVSWIVSCDAYLLKFPCIEGSPGTLGLSTRSITFQEKVLIAEAMIKLASSYVLFHPVSIQSVCINLVTPSGYCFLWYMGRLACSASCWVIRVGKGNRSRGLGTLY